MTFRNQMMVKSQAVDAAEERKRIQKGQTTEKLGAIISGQAYSDKDSVEMNLGSFSAQKAKDIDPTDFIESTKFQKRDFLLQVFR